MDRTDKTPAQMAAHLIENLLFAPEALAYAQSKMHERRIRGDENGAAYWAEVDEALDAIVSQR
jgi:hypothetical protein